jgi:hypothetical protein
MPADTVAPRTTREQKLLAEGKPPFKGAIWFGRDYGWGIKRTKASAAVFERASAALRK